VSDDAGLTEPPRVLTEPIRTLDMQRPGRSGALPGRAPWGFQHQATRRCPLRVKPPVRSSVLMKGLVDYPDSPISAERRCAGAPPSRPRGPRGDAGFPKHLRAAPTVISWFGFSLVGRARPRKRERSEPSERDQASRAAPLSVHSTPNAAPKPRFTGGSGIDAVRPTSRRRCRLAALVARPRPAAAASG
jgi:hypothetical protein